MYVSMYVCIHVYVYMCAYISISISISLSIYICIHECLHTEICNILPGCRLQGPLVCDPIRKSEVGSDSPDHQPLTRKP